MAFDMGRRPEAHTDRQSQRLIFAYETAALLTMASSLAWAIYFLFMERWPIATANTLLVALAGGAWLLIRAGRLNTALIVSELSLVIFAIFYGLMFDPPSAEIPRITHLYLLVLAMLGYLGHLRRRSVFQLAVTAVSLTAFVFLACSTYAFPFAQAIPDEIRATGIWVNGILATAMMCGGIYVLQREFSRPKGLALELRNAVRNGEMELYFQPQIDRAGTILGAEALIRWQHPKRGQVAPNDFIPVAEAAGLMPLIGGWVIEEACRTLAHWRGDPALGGLTLAVNVSADQFQVEEFERSVLAAVRLHGVDPSRLKIELTESVVVHSLAPVIAKIDNLRAAGIRFALDDFGTGYSSLSYLRQLPLDQIKIDRSFVRDSLDSERGTALVKSIVHLGLDLGLVVVAEGVETPAQHAFLSDCGCHEFQGYLFGRPMPAGAFAAHVREAMLAAALTAPDLLRATLADWPERYAQRAESA
ncbi:EAL domain-containing protein [Hoeflea sp. BAL378]|uniref:putative bifunctional diguanylate cyclase/phosphodiesterase n=1 Tax=Hoeflea sp. BAL378 TaxID=1547437 RepID=UPI0006893169|nr:EAL domain-containing protein [Hoeflea sp. BAL378]